MQTVNKFFQSLLCVLMIVVSANAQVNDTARLVIKYDFSHMRDTTDPEDIYRDNMVLYIGKRYSQYASINRIDAARQIAKMVEERQKMSASDQRAIPVNLAGLKEGLGTAYYYNMLDGKLQTVEDIVGRLYYFDDVMPVIDWEIGKETKTISGMICQKANGRCRGRMYEVWFCPALPYQIGPWKLTGLPGLILEAYDTKKQVVFSFAGMEDISAQSLPMQIPASAIKATVEEVAKVKSAMEKNMNAMMSGMYSTVRASGGNGTAPPRKQKVYNNPIEKSKD